MTIKETITKAIEGGYRLKLYEKYEQKVEFFVAEEVDGKVTKYNPYWVKFLVTTTHIDGNPFISINKERVEYLFLDHLFWQCLGKAMEWKKSIFRNGEMLPNTWLSNWHRLIDHLAEGKTIESFFEDFERMEEEKYRRIADV